MLKRGPTVLTFIGPIAFSPYQFPYLYLLHLPFYECNDSKVPPSFPTSPILTLGYFLLSPKNNPFLSVPKPALEYGPIMTRTCRSHLSWPRKMRRSMGRRKSIFRRMTSCGRENCLPYITRWNIDVKHGPIKENSDSPMKTVSRVGRRGAME